MNIFSLLVVMNTVITSLFGIPSAADDTPPADQAPAVVSAEAAVAKSIPEPVADDADTALPVQTEPPGDPPPEEVTVPENGYVYLTFDDGPGKYTEQILSVLAEHDVKATFFVVGQFASYYPERVRAIYDAGHDIACHSATHDYYAIYGSAETITADIIEWEKIIESAIGCVPDTRLYRFPGGSNCTALPAERFPELYSAVSALGYRAFDWNCANNDKWHAGKGEDMALSDYLKESVISSVKLCRGDKIMLLHETVAETADMLPWLIGYLQSEGYGFAPLSGYEGEYLFMPYA